MPISGIVIRFVSAHREQPDLLRIKAVPHVELGKHTGSAASAVIDAPDYFAHDSALSALAEVSGVAAVDIVFHDFSDITVFGRLPDRRRTSR